jgi:GST-like protein
MIELYGMSSPNVRKILLALEEMDLPYHSRHVSVFRSGQFEPDFMAMNPLSKVPVLIDPAGAGKDCPIFESGAILIYLAETYAPHFYPATGPARWEVLKWLMVQIANIGPIFGQHSFFRQRADSAPYAAARFRHTAARLYQLIEDRLMEHEWLAGDAYSIADMATYPWARYLRRHGLDPAGFPAIAAWRQQIESRPATARAAAVCAELGKRDAADLAAATPEDQERLLWRHFPAPTEEAAGGRKPSLF